MRQVGEAVATLKGMYFSFLLLVLLTTMAKNSFAFDLEALTFTSKKIYSWD